MTKDDKERALADASVPDALTTGEIKDEMDGVTNPREKLDGKRTPKEAAKRLMTGPHDPEFEPKPANGPA